MTKFFIPVYLKNKELLAYCRFGFGDQRYADRAVLLKFITLYVAEVCKRNKEVNDYHVQIIYEHRSDKRFYIWKEGLEDQFCPSISNKDGLDLINNGNVFTNINVSGKIGNIEVSPAIFAFYDEN